VKRVFPTPLFSLIPHQEVTPSGRGIIQVNSRALGLDLIILLDRREGRKGGRKVSADCARSHAGVLDHVPVRRHRKEGGKRRMIPHSIWRPPPACSGYRKREGGRRKKKKDAAS